MSTTNILSSWKEIAAYVGRGVRTLQRYEAQRGFPVHRVAGNGGGGSVVAFTEEIDLWLSTAPEGAFMLVDRKDAPAELQAAKKEVQEAYAAYQRSLQRYHGLTTGFSQQ
ncbi:MAG TPA: hypothetical protein VH196_04080, partial [Terriglobales bacterium]|nr:hypothetical protein [Terriglobales bacterium]